MQFTRIEDATGRILSTESYVEQVDVDTNYRKGTTLYSGFYDSEKKYYDETLSQMVDRPIMDLSITKMTVVADGVDAFTINGLPKGKTDVSIDGPVGGRWVESSKTLSLTVDIPGAYVLQLSQFPYITETIKFNGT